jgi:hypothetical protein
MIVNAEKVRVTYRSAVAVTSATLHYTTDSGLRSKRAWQSMPAEIADGLIIAPKPPANANTWFISLTDAQGGMTTTAVQFQP